MKKVCIRQLGYVGFVLALLLTVCATGAFAHNTPGIPDFSDAMANIRTVRANSIPNGNNGDNGIGFPTDPRDLTDGNGRGIVFHEHFRGDAPFDDSFHGTVVFTVFNGPDYTPCGMSGPILPPLPIVYTNSLGGYNLNIDFGQVNAGNAGADDFGVFNGEDWIYAYVIVNDEGDQLVPNPDGTLDSISSNILSFARGLRQITADIPTLGARGGTIGCGGDIEGAPANNVDPVSFTFITTFGALIGYDAIPDVGDGGAIASNIIYLTSFFGPGVANISHQGGSKATVTEENVVLGPLTYPNARCDDLTINNLTNPGMPVAVGDMIQLVVDVNNLGPVQDPPYSGTSIPGGTQRGVFDVDISTMGGTISGLTTPQRVCTEIRGEGARSAQAIFTGTFQGPNTTIVTAAVSVPSPYDTGPKPPFDSTAVGYQDRFIVTRPDLDCTETIGVRPSLEIEKEVQFICFNDPANANDVTIGPLGESVCAPVCGLVRFSITVSNTTTIEGVTNVKLTDCLPNDLLYRNNTMPNTPFGGLPGAPDCAGTGATTQFVFDLPDLAAMGMPGDSYTFTFDAIVSSGAAAGLVTNFARAIATGVISNEDSDVVEDTATVDIKTIDASMVNRGAVPDIACTGQTVEFTYRYTNTGLFDLDPVIVGTCTADPGLMILSQNPAPGTDVGPLAIGAFFDITVMAKANEGVSGERCITCEVDALPDCYDPRDTEDCSINRDATECAQFVNVDIDVQCLTATTDAEPGDMAIFQFEITNNGDVVCDDLTLECVPGIGMIIIDCPADPGPLNPGDSVIVDVAVQVDANADGTVCATLNVICNPAGLPDICTASDSAQCCLRLNTEIPTLGTYGMILLMSLLGVAMVRRRYLGA